MLVAPLAAGLLVEPASRSAAKLHPAACARAPGLRPGAFSLEFELPKLLPGQYSLEMRLVEHVAEPQTIKVGDNE